MKQPTEGNARPSKTVKHPHHAWHWPGSRRLRAWPCVHAAHTHTHTQTHTHTRPTLSFLGLKDAMALFWKASIYCLLMKPQFLNTSWVCTHTKCNTVKFILSLDLGCVSLPVTTLTADAQESAAGTRFTLYPGLHSCKGASSQPISWFITISTRGSLRRVQIQGKVILFGTLPKALNWTLEKVLKGKEILEAQLECIFAMLLWDYWQPAGKHLTCS